MQISTKGRYAVRALLYMTQHKDEKTIKLKDICSSTKISFKYLENIMRSLVNAGIVSSTKGKGGGFSLGRNPDDIRLSDIIMAAEGTLDPVFCVSLPDKCENSEWCVYKDIWTELKLRTIQFLSSLTLSDVEKRQDIKLAILEKKGKSVVKGEKGHICGG